MGKHSDAVLCYRNTGGKAPCLNKLFGGADCPYSRTCKLNRHYRHRKAFIFHWNGETYKFYSLQDCMSSDLWDNVWQLRSNAEYYFRNKK